MGRINIVHPHEVDPAEGTKIFLAGTIDMGNSENWQQDYIDYFSKDQENSKRIFTMYNPRRKEGFGDNEEEYEYQVNWELDRLESADLIIMNILGTSKSPITLFELGNFKSKNIKVICEPNFYRYKYVKMFCERYHISLYNSMQEFKEYYIFVKDDTSI